MKFLIDAQLPKALARRLALEGHEAAHVLDLKLGQLPDNAVWRHAEETDAIIVSKDEDFAQWVLSGRTGPRILWLRIGNCTNQELLDWLFSAWPDVMAAFEGGERLVEVA